VITSVDRNTLPEDLLCRTYDKSFLSDLPVNVDPCGENGEFHTFVFAGPIFKAPLSVKSGEVIRDGNLSFCDIITKDINPTKLAVAMS
jgi:diphthamide synthase (EF-2-diphthine--ammonia ligase)